jgi:hypothetical protein
MTAVTLMMLARIPEDGRTAFDTYENTVLPLVARYRGTLERRLRSTDDGTEIHLITFASAEDYQAYRKDPQRLAAAPGLEASRADIELFTVRDI